MTILFTEPGSNGEETARLPSCRLSWRPMSWLGSNVLSFDIASTSPVFASSTTAETFLAPDGVLGLLHLLLDVELDVVVEGQLRPSSR